MQHPISAATSQGHSARFAFITVFLDAMASASFCPSCRISSGAFLSQHQSGGDLWRLSGICLRIHAVFMRPDPWQSLRSFRQTPGFALLSCRTCHRLFDYGPRTEPLVAWLGRFIAGIAGATHATAFAYVADVSKPEDRTRNFGLVNAAFGFGFIAGPLIGGLIASLEPARHFSLPLDWLHSMGSMVLSFCQKACRRANDAPFHGQEAILPVRFFRQAISRACCGSLRPSCFSTSPAGFIPRSGPITHGKPSPWSSREIGLSLASMASFMP